MVVTTVVNFPFSFFLFSLLFILSSCYCICLVSIWWCQYWTKNNRVWLAPKPRSQAKDCGRRYKLPWSLVLIYNIVIKNGTLSMYDSFGCVKVKFWPPYKHNCTTVLNVYNSFLYLQSYTVGRCCSLRFLCSP